MYLAYTVTDADGPATVAPPQSTQPQPATTIIHDELAALFAIIERLDTMIRLLPALLDSPE